MSTPTLRNTKDPCREYKAVHATLRRERGVARDRLCIHCGQRALDWAFQYPDGRTKICPNTRRRYSSDIADYAPMCRSCHLRFDWTQDLEMAESLSSIRREVTSRPKTEEHLERIWESRRSDPDGMKRHSRLMSQTMSRTNSRRFRCGECSLESNAGNLGKHQRASGHSGREEVTG